MKKVLLVACLSISSLFAQAQLGLSKKEISLKWGAEKVNDGHFSVEDDFAQFNFYFNDEGICFSYQYNSKSLMANSFLKLILQGEYKCLNPNEIVMQHWEKVSNKNIVVSVTDGRYMSALFFNKEL